MKLIVRIRTINCSGNLTTQIIALIVRTLLLQFQYINIILMIFIWEFSTIFLLTTFTKMTTIKWTCYKFGIFLSIYITLYDYFRIIWYPVFGCFVCTCSPYLYNLSIYLYLVFITLVFLANYIEKKYRCEKYGRKRHAQYVVLMVKTGKLITASIAGKEDTMKSASVPFDGNKEIKM